MSKYPLKQYCRGGWLPSLPTEVLVRPLILAKLVQYGRTYEGFVQDGVGDLDIVYRYYASFKIVFRMNNFDFENILIRITSNINKKDMFFASACFISTSHSLSPHILFVIICSKLALQSFSRISIECWIKLYGLYI